MGFSLAKCCEVLALQGIFAFEREAFPSKVGRGGEEIDVAQIGPEILVSAYKSSFKVEQKLLPAEYAAYGKIKVSASDPGIEIIGIEPRTTVHAPQGKPVRE